MKNSNRIPSITIGIAAHNEEANITNLLHSVLIQKQEGFVIQEILLLSDASTDKTVEKVKAISDKRITVVDNKERVGKSQRLNEIFSMAKGDIIVLLDADVVIDSPDVIAYLVKPFMEDKEMGLVGGNPHPAKAKTFVEEAINLTYRVYAPLRTMVRNGRNPFGCDGRILALSRAFAKSVHIPQSMIGNDSYLYFSCLKKGFHFIHQPLARVTYRSATNLQDHVKQNTRFIAAEYIHLEVFGPLVQKEYSIGRKLFLKLISQQAYKQPLHAVFIFFVNRYSQFMAKKKYMHMGGIWSTASSTKERITK